MKEIYMNMKKIILLLAGSALLSSCAVVAGERGIESKLIEQNRRAVGVYRLNLTEPILMSLAGRCNVPLFVIKARKESEIDNVIDIAMIETCSSPEPGKTVCKCEYSGIGVLYSEINNPDEASTWMGSDRQTSKEKKEDNIPSTAPNEDHVRVKETNK
jgi:hypothetical protein